MSSRSTVIEGDNGPGVRLPDNPRGRARAAVDAARRQQLAKQVAKARGRPVVEFGAVQRRRSSGRAASRQEIPDLDGTLSELGP